MEELERIPRSKLSVPAAADGRQLRSESDSIIDNTRTRSSPPIRVCVIGAGLAGLSVAEALSLRSKDEGDLDIQVTVLEAMGRPGGRAVTMSFAGGLVEGGAQFIHGCDGNAVYHRAKQHKLKVVATRNPSNTFSMHKSDGKRVPASFIAEVGKFYDEVLLRTQARAYEDERRTCGEKTVGAYMRGSFERYHQRSTGSPLDKQVKANIFRNLTLNECCYSACNHLDDLMLRDFGEYKELLGNVQIVGGYREFVGTFLKNLAPGTVVYNTPVREINWRQNEGGHPDPKPVHITCQDGKEYKADYVVVTTSLGYLKEHASTMFSPPLPDEKTKLIGRMGFGTAAKIWLEYEEPFWGENWGGIYLLWNMNASDIMKNSFKEKEWYKYIASITRVQNNPRLLIAWICGKAAEHMETLDREVIGKTLTDVLRQFLSNPNIPLPVRVEKSQWFSNPYVRGSYSYVAAGSEGGDIDSFAEPVCIPSSKGPNKPVICFAGEATHRTFYSTTHGAMLSGQREAERIVGDIRLRAGCKFVLDVKEDQAVI